MHSIKCLNCGKMLTDGLGDVINNANFDSVLPHMPDSQGFIIVVLARCDKCYAVALKENQCQRDPSQDKLQT